MAVGKHEIVFPLGGLNRAAPFEKQPPFSTRRARNVLPSDFFYESNRGGPRPGLDKWFRYNTVNGANPVRMLANVDLVDPNNQTVWEDTFTAASLGALWAQLPLTFAGTNDAGHGNTTVTGIPTLDRGLAYVAGTGASTAVHKAVYLTSPSPWSLADDSTDTWEYRVEVFVVPNRGTTNAGSKVEVFLRLGDSSPNYDTQGIRVALGFTDGVGGYGGNVTVRQAGVELDRTPFATGNTQDSGGNNVAMPGWFSVCLRQHGIDGGFIDVYWRGNALLTNYNIPKTIGPPVINWPVTGDRVVGFGLEAAGAANRISIDSFRLIYRTNTATNRSIMVASSGSTNTNGNIARERKLNEIEELPTYGANILAGDRSLSWAQRGRGEGTVGASELFIADNGPIIALASDGTTSGLISGISFKLQSATYPNWTTAGVIAGTHNVLIRNPDDNFSHVYSIITVGTADLTLRTSRPNEDIANHATANLNFRIERGPKVYRVYHASAGEWANGSYTGTRSATESLVLGELPLGCPIFCAWQDRLVAAGCPSEPTIVRASRSGDWYDFDIAADPEDEGRAWSYVLASAGSNAATPGKLVTAMIPFTADYLVIGNRDELQKLPGSPTVGAVATTLSRNVGIVSKFAWCMTPDGTAPFLSYDGLFAITGEGGALPVELSRGTLPQELREINADVHTVLMGYDRRTQCVLIFVSPHHSHWAFHWPTKTFWPLELPANFEPYALVDHQSQSAQDRGIYLGCKDGYIRRFYLQHHRDGEHNLSSYVLYGPIMLGRGTDDFGILREIVARLAADSASITWSIHVGQTVEQALARADAGTATFSGTFSQAGLTTRSHPRSAGRYAFIKIADNGGTVYRPWALESLMIDVEAAGLQRV